ncbi:YoaK family protein [Conexibacter sp. CPCC 206217]|uniref:YoaK family protein n=1 Tax=Conexibacter sp. CPCC 206217 TaxID=3064574 RepID=UPI002726983A|nr:YoaK family protein [Conexibacter sp. CPCC 206217]MDO8213615.1 YoaK family protein [Conexibacter sp. CPCC 206217]
MSSTALSDATGPRRLSERDAHVLLLLGLTLATGAVDAVSYFSLDHVFTANMSGNMALLGVGVATSIHDVAGNVYAFIGFVTGAILTGRFVRAHDHWPLRTVTRGLAVELVLLIGLAIVAGVADVPGDKAVRFSVCFVLAAAMGLQTGLARHLAVQDVNTTVATMTLHDLAAASKLAGGDSVRWKRRAGVVFALFAGAAIGVGCDRIVPWGGLAFTAGVVALIMVLTAKAARIYDPPRRSA